jgi:hypothetical protein
LRMYASRCLCEIPLKGYHFLGYNLNKGLILI